MNLSIKNVPDHIAERLRQRAADSHRSLQGELMKILEEAITRREKLTSAALLDVLRKMEVKTGDEATEMIRADRAR